MFSDEFRALARPQVLIILEIVKKSRGITVSDLAKEMEMSYMGVKQHCMKLEVMGFLKTWRVPREGVGRPEKLYILTEKCDELFPQAGVELSLNVMEGVRRFFGESGPEKILFHHYEQLRNEWMPVVKKGKSIVEKATRLANLRDEAGCFSRCYYSPSEGFRIEEFHHPMRQLFEKFPTAIQQELKMMEILLGTKVNRKVLKMEKGGEIIVYEILVLG